MRRLHFTATTGGGHRKKPDAGISRRAVEPGRIPGPEVGNVVAKIRGESTERCATPSPSGRDQETVFQPPPAFASGRSSQPVEDFTSAGSLFHHVTSDLTSIRGRREHWVPRGKSPALVAKWQTTPPRSSSSPGAQNRQTRLTREGVLLVRYPVRSRTAPPAEASGAAPRGRRRVRMVTSRWPRLTSDTKACETPPLVPHRWRHRRLRRGRQVRGQWFGRRRIRRDRLSSVLIRRGRRRAAVSSRRGLCATLG
jgi:hypothetical protein